MSFLSKSSSHPSAPRAAAIAVIAAAASAAGTVGNTYASTSGTAPVTKAQLQAEINVLKSQLSQVRQHENSASMSSARKVQVMAIVKEVLAKSKQNSQYMGSQVQAGYDNGFYIRSAHKAFQLNINGYLQMRYTYSKAAAGNNNTAAGGRAAGPFGNSSGFDFRRARLILSGNAFKNIIYSISGDFADGSGPTGLGNTFQILDTWIGYEFIPGFMIRAGSIIVPFTHVEYYSAGTEFPEFAAAEAPFDPVRSLALDAFGNLNKNTLFYDVQVNNGSKANNLDGSANPTGPGTFQLDNRFGFYGRIQFAGAGNNNDFMDSPDVAWHKHLVWAIGVAAGYEEQNSSAGVYPSPQNSLALIGLATPGGGFLGGETASGTMYRATVDGHVKYRGFAFNSSVYFQQYNAATPGAGGSTPALYSTYGTGSPWQLGAYGEAGYFLVPHRWELAGRVGDLTTDGRGKQSMEYTAGVNYYIFGENAKIQTAVTYLPNAAYSSPNIGSVINTSDIIGQIQFQVKF